jgi:hypothetical protein
MLLYGTDDVLLTSGTWNPPTCSRPQHDDDRRATPSEVAAVPFPARGRVRPFSLSKGGGGGASVASGAAAAAEPPNRPLARSSSLQGVGSNRRLVVSTERRLCLRVSTRTPLWRCPPTAHRPPPTCSAGRTDRPSIDTAVAGTASSSRSSSRVPSETPVGLKRARQTNGPSSGRRRDLKEGAPRPPMAKVGPCF